MGKRRDPKLYRLVFADGDYEGLTMTLRSVSIRDLNAMATTGEETEAQARMRLTELIASHLVEWNREDENGIPLPATLESLLDEEPKLIHVVVEEWTQAITGVSAPLDGASPSGGLSAEVDARLMEIPSESLPS